MADLRELGAHAHLYDEDGDDLGFCHVPWPLSLGDLAAVEGGDVIAQVEPVQFVLTG